MLAKLKATTAILRQLDLEQRGAVADSHRVRSRVLHELVFRYGGTADADALFPRCLAKPGVSLLPILQRHGTRDMGRQLFEAFVGEDGLRGNAPSDVPQKKGPRWERGPYKVVSQRH